MPHLKMRHAKETLPRQMWAMRIGGQGTTRSMTSQSANSQLHQVFRSAMRQTSTKISYACKPATNQQANTTQNLHFSCSSMGPQCHITSATHLQNTSTSKTQLSRAARTPGSFFTLLCPSQNGINLLWRLVGISTLHHLVIQQSRILRQILPAWQPEQDHRRSLQQRDLCNCFISARII